MTGAVRYCRIDMTEIYLCNFVAIPRAGVLQRERKFDGLVVFNARPGQRASA